MATELTRDRIYDLFGLTAEEREFADLLEEIERPARAAATREREAFLAYARERAAEVEKTLVGELPTDLRSKLSL